MTPDMMAAIHQAAFTHERGWRADEFTSLLAQPYTATYTANDGFALTRALTGESELLTLAVAPDQQRRGIASDLLSQWITAIRQTAETAFLEVAADNYGALALYEKHGFIRTGLRKAYYGRTNGTRVDAVLMTCALTQG